MIRAQYPAADDEQRRLGGHFANAEPFPHVVLADFLAQSAEEVVPHFPSPDWQGWNSLRGTYQKNKMSCEDVGQIPEFYLDIIAELSAPPFLGFLETLSGIRGLIPDPYLEGGGLHCSTAGGILTPHTDFHDYPRLELFRCLNLLVYLNPDWKESYGGCLELWKKGDSSPTKSVVPSYGTCVIFLTNDTSVHGFSVPVTEEGGARRSLALYYYVSREFGTFSGDTTTYWQSHGSLKGRTFRFGLYRGLQFMARNFAKLAYLANPMTRSVDPVDKRAAKGLDET